MTTLPEQDIALCKQAVGLSIKTDEQLDKSALSRLVAAIGSDWMNEDTLHPVAHWAWFNDVVSDRDIGRDGHPRRGLFLPKIANYPRRMFASSSITYFKELILNRSAQQRAKITDVRHRIGSSGPLLLVDVDREILQYDQRCVLEKQTIVYRSSVAKVTSTGTVKERLNSQQAKIESWIPSTVQLFRFSAATFNSHRIHYDQRYAICEEGYYDLVVQGPFVLARLAVFAARHGRLASLVYRAKAPAFVDQLIHIVNNGNNEFSAISEENSLIATLKVTYQ